MARYGGHRIPDEYHSDWEKIKLGEYWDWWHLGYEDGVRHTKYEYEGYGYETEKDDTPVKRLEKLAEENEQLRSLLAANVRVIKEELKKELVNEKEERNDQTQELASSIRPGGTVLPGSTRV